MILRTFGAMFLAPLGVALAYGEMREAAGFAADGAMWIGRLGVTTVLALLRPEVWRSVRVW